MKSKPLKRPGPRSGAGRQDEAFLSWVTGSDKFTIEAALAMYAPGRTVPLTPAERAALDGVDLGPLLRAGIEIGLADYPGRNAILKSMNDALDAANGTSDALIRGNDDKET